MADDPTDEQDGNHDPDPESQALLRAGLKPGDILFYKTDAASTFFELNPAAFGDDFPTLAAFAQALPYVLRPSGNMWSPHPTHFKPWHHVAICVAEATDEAPARAVGYLQDNYAAQGTETDGVITADTSRIAEYDVGPVPGQRLSVLRKKPVGSEEDLPDGHMQPAVDYSRNLVGDQDSGKEPIGYSILGLLSFALATKARMLPAGPVRDETLLMAYGAHRRARAKDLEEAAEGALPPESCVTAVAMALEAVLGGEVFELPEPAPPDPAETAKLFAYQLSPLTEALAQLLTRIEGAGGDLALMQLDEMTVADLDDMIPRFAHHTVLLSADAKPGAGLLAAAVAEHRRIMDVTLGIGAAPGDGSILDPGLGGPVIPEPPPEPPPGDTPYSPGPGTSTEQYIPTLEGVAEVLTDDAGDSKSLVELGLEELADVSPVPSSRHLVASPAMLWDALTGTHGFVEVFG